MDEVRYVSATEAAERLGISLRTIRRRIADGTLPSIKVGGAVRIPLSALEPPATAKGGTGHAAREAAAPYAASSEEHDADIRRWNREHWPDTWERMLGRRRAAIEEILELSKRTRPPSGPHDTVDAMLDEVREEFGARLVQYLPPAPEDDPS